jgi:hypothetical protein
VSYTTGYYNSINEQTLDVDDAYLYTALHQQGMLLEQGGSSEGGPVPGTVLGTGVGEEHAFALALHRQQQAELQHHHSLQHNLQQQRQQQARYAAQQAQLEEKHSMHAAEVARTAQQQQEQQHSGDATAAAAGATAGAGAGTSARSSITSSEDAEGEASIRRVLDRCVQCIQRSVH